MDYKDKNLKAFSSKVTFLLIVILGGILAYASVHFFLRADLTESKQYAISDSTKKMLRNLDDLVNVRIYFSKQLPPDLMRIESYVRDILGEYDAYAKGNLNIEYLDPGKSSVAQEAQSYGIPQIQMNVYTKDKFEIQNGYLGLTILYEDKFETIPIVENVLNLEYDLSSAILKVTASEVRTVGFSQGNGEPELIGRDSEFELLSKNLLQNYSVIPVDLAEGNSLDTVNTLIVAGVKNELDEIALYNLDQFIAKGGDVIFLVDTVNVNEGLIAEKPEHNLNEFLENVGVQVGSDMVLDHSNEHASFNQGFVNYIVPYPFWVKLIPQFFDESSPVVSKLGSVVLPWTSALEISEKEGFDYAVLATTTERSMTQSEPFNLNPEVAAAGDSSPKLPMIALISGSYTSFFKDKDINGFADSSDDFVETSLSPVRIFVVGNSDFALDRFMRQFPQNRAFLMNSIDYLTMDESLIGIRSKAIKFREIKELSDSERMMIKFLGVWLMPILVVIAGGLRAYWIRKVRALKSF